MAGKGDGRRPSAVSTKEFEANWRRIFASQSEVDESRPHRVIEKRDWIDGDGRWRSSVKITSRSADDIEGMKIAAKLREDVKRLNAR